MKKHPISVKYIVSFMLTALALLLELLPCGAVLRFANPEGEAWVKTVSYFSLLPYGYGNVGPFLTAVATCLSLMLTLLCVLWKNAKKMRVVRLLTEALSVLFSLLPLLFGFAYYSLTAGLITLCLALSFLFLVSGEK